MARPKRVGGGAPGAAARRRAGQGAGRVGRGARDRAADAGPSAAASATTVPCVEEDEFAAGLDLVVALGGDGTLLRALGLVLTEQVPALGVNAGRLGFLAEVEPSGLGDALVAVWAGRYRVERRTTLAATVLVDGQEIAEDLAVNDVVLEKAARERLAAVAVSLGDGGPFARYAADGVMASPTGSTAYTRPAGRSRPPDWTPCCSPRSPRTWSSTGPRPAPRRGGAHGGAAGQPGDRERRRAGRPRAAAGRGRAGPPRPPRRAAHPDRAADFYRLVRSSSASPTPGHRHPAHDWPTGRPGPVDGVRLGVGQAG